MKNPAIKGYIWAFIGILAVSNVYIFSKAALLEVHITQFGFYWFAFGLLWNLIYAIKSCKLSTFRNLHKKQFWILILVGILEVVGTTSFFYGIQTLENPSVAAFLANMSPVFVTILGIAVLKERFNYFELAGMLLTVGGAFIISYHGQGSIKELFIPGTEYIIFSSFIFAFTTIIIKRNIVSLPPALLSLNRVIYLLIFSTIMIFVFDQSFQISNSALVNISIGSVLGPFLTVFAAYNALKYIEASRQSILGSTKGIFVLLGAYIYFNSIPYGYQIIGGIISIIGVLLVTFGRIKIIRKKPIQ